MDIGLAFTFPTQDDAWIKKLVITAVILLIPFIGPIAGMGWMIEITRRVIRDDPQPLPDWSNFGGILGDGFKLFIVSLVYSIPILIISLPAALLGSSTDSDTAVALAGAISLLFGCLSFFYGLALALILPAATGELASSGDLGAALNPGKLIARIRSAPSAYLIALLGGVLASFLAGIGIVLCVVGVLFTGAYAYAVLAHLYGQAYKQTAQAA